MQLLHHCACSFCITAHAASASLCLQLLHHCACSGVPLCALRLHWPAAALRGPSSLCLHSFSCHPVIMASPWHATPFPSQVVDKDGVPAKPGDLLCVEICNLGPLPGDEWGERSQRGLRCLCKQRGLSAGRGNRGSCTHRKLARSKVWVALVSMRGGTGGGRKGGPGTHSMPCGMFWFQGSMLGLFGRVSPACLTILDWPCTPEQATLASLTARTVVASSQTTTRTPRRVSVGVDRW